MNRVTERDSFSTSDTGPKILSIILETLKWMFLITVLVFTLAPLVWVGLSSLKTNGEIFTSTFSLTKEIQFINYRKAFALDGLIQEMEKPGYTPRVD